MSVPVPMDDLPTNNAPEVVIAILFAPLLKRDTAFVNVLLSGKLISAVPAVKLEVPLTVNGAS